MELTKSGKSPFRSLNGGKLIEITFNNENYKFNNENYIQINKNTYKNIHYDEFSIIQIPLRIIIIKYWLKHCYYRPPTDIDNKGGPGYQKAINVNN